MKRLVIATLATLATACGSKPPPEPTPQPLSSKPAPPPSSAPDVTRFFTAAVTGAMRADANNSPIVSYLASLLQPPPACWTTLTGAIRASYQLEVAGHGSYFLFDGELPRAEVERCITTALGDVLDVHVTHQGDLSVFASPRGGTAYAAWRGSVVIAGTEAQVAAALLPNDPSVAARWHDRLATLPAGVMAMWRADALLANLFGVPTSSYALAITRVAKSPKPSFAGQIVVQYASPEDAALAAQRIHAGELAKALSGAPPALVAALQRMHVTAAANQVTIDFDDDMFAGLDLGQLQRWLGPLTATP